jgi:hypothetical protein
VVEVGEGMLHEVVGEEDKVRIILNAINVINLDIINLNVPLGKKQIMPSSMRRKRCF